MLVPLSEVLELPSFRAAGVTVVAGEVRDVMVRWVHSSEVYEMGSLLAGGEVLLTTGLGLHGRSPEQLAAYVEQLADAGCVAIGLEVGRSLFEIPASMLEAADRRGVVLVTFGAVVPFERMVEDFHELLLQRKLGAARSGEPLWRDFLAVVVAGEGLRSLLDAISRAAGCLVEYHDTEGHVIERSRISSVGSESQEVATDVRVASGSAGTLVLRGAPTRRRTAVAERGAVAVALELGRHPGVGQRPSLAQSAITDLAAGVLASGGEVHRRLTEAGWVLAEGQHVIVAAVAIDPRTPVLDLVPVLEEAFAPVSAAPLVGAVGSDAVVLLRGWARPLPQRVRSQVGEAATTLAELAPAAGSVVAVGTPTADLSGVAGQVAQARDVLRIAQRFGIRSGVVLARDVGAQRLLSTGVEPSVASEFVAEQIGPLIEHDRAYAADLVRTLDAYLAAGLSKAATARALGIRRQSLYGRMARIEALLGVSLGDPVQVMGLGLALTSWRMRTGLDPQSVFERAQRAR